MEYTLYLLHCSDGSLYTGIAKDLESRLETHKSGEGSKYVRSRLPFKVVYTEGLPDRSSATKREYEIKSWSRDKKVRELGIDFD